MTTFKLPKPEAYKVWRAMCEPYLSDRKEKDAISNEPLYTARSLRDVLEQAAQEATDAIAFNGGTVQMEAHVRDAIRKMIGEI